MQHRLDDIEAGATRSDQVTHRREQEEEEVPNGRNILEDCTDRSEEEDDRAHVRQTPTRAGRSRA